MPASAMPERFSRQSGLASVSATSPYMPEQPVIDSATSVMPGDFQRAPSFRPSGLASVSATSPYMPEGSLLDNSVTSSAMPENLERLSQRPSQRPSQRISQRLSQSPQSLSQNALANLVAELTPDQPSDTIRLSGLRTSAVPRPSSALQRTSSAVPRASQDAPVEIGIIADALRQTANQMPVGLEIVSQPPRVSQSLVGEQPRVSQSFLGEQPRVSQSLVGEQRLSSGLAVPRSSLVAQQPRSSLIAQPESSFDLPTVTETPDVRTSRGSRAPSGRIISMTTGDVLGERNSGRISGLTNTDTEVKITFSDETPRQYGSRQTGPRQSGQRQSGPKETNPLQDIIELVTGPLQKRQSSSVA